MDHTDDSIVVHAHRKLVAQQSTGIALATCYSFKNEEKFIKHHGPPSVEPELIPCNAVIKTPPPAPKDIDTIRFKLPLTPARAQPVSLLLGAVNLQSLSGYKDKENHKSSVDQNCDA